MNHSAPSAFPHHNLETLTDEQAVAQHHAAARAVDSARKAANNFSDDYESAMQGDRVRQYNVYNAGITSANRGFTDPYDDAGNKRTTPGTNETLLGRYGAGLLIDGMAKRYSINGPNKDAVNAGQSFTDRNGADQQLNYGELSRREKRRIIKASKRDFKQDIRASRSQKTADVFGVSKGVGKQSRTRTAIARHDAKSDLKQDLRDGSISPANYASLKKAARYTTVERVQGRATTRDIRRERLGAIYNTVQADEVVTGFFRKRRAARMVNKIHGAALQENSARDTRQALAEDIERRRREAKAKAAAEAAAAAASTTP